MKGSKIIKGSIVALILTFAGFAIAAIPHLTLFMSILVGTILGLWILILSWFLFVFNKFIKTEKGS
jgi:hypothetical protein